MNKKKILSLTLALVMILPTTSFAKGNDSSRKNGNVVKQEVQTIKNEDDSKEEAKIKGEEHKQEAEKNRTEKKKQIEEFKTAMRTKHEKMNELRTQTKDLRHQVKQKRDQLSTILNDIQSGKKTLSEDMLSSLLTLSQSLQADGEQIKATAKINTEVTDTEEKVKGLDFNNALASMDKVIAKMQARFDALNKLNSDLDASLKIANLAVAPAVETAPTTTTNTTDSPTETSTVQ